jgi:predicted ATPase with chaperone activity
MVTKYQKRISGPLLNRIDIHIEVPRVHYDKLSSDRMGEASSTIRSPMQAELGGFNYATFSNLMENKIKASKIPASFF